MRTFARWPAIFVLLAATGVGAYAMRAHHAAATQSDARTLEDLERLIADGNADARTWVTYADKLRFARRFSHAAAAYRRAIESQPPLADPRDARFGLALSYAQSDNANDFFAYMSQLVLTDARLASDILERKECQAKAADARFAPLVQEAKIQAMD